MIEDSDEWHKARINKMLIEFYVDCVKAGMNEYKRSIGYLGDFTDKWIDIHFPYVFSEFKCSKCQKRKKK